MDDLLSMRPLQPSQALVVDVAFPCTLVSPTFGVSQPYIADSPAKTAYVDAVEAELGSVDDGLRVRPVAALRLSGGASLMSADKVCHLVRRLRRELAVEPRAQVAVDVEPLTVGTPSLTNWTSCGVNRVNLAVWSAVDSELAALGVPHRREQVQDALLFLEKFHLGNVNVRLLFGLPGQTPRSWEESLRTFAAVDCPHIEIRPLVEPVAEKASRLPDRTARRALYLQACEVLGGRGYVEYLPGMFVRSDAPHARDGFAMAQTAGADLLALGAGARNRWDGFLYENDPDFDGYVRNAADFEKLARNPRREGADARQMRRAVGLLDAGYSFASGDLLMVDDDGESDAGGAAGGELHPAVQAWLDEQVAVGLLSVSDGRYALTDEGRFARVEHAGAELAL